MSTDLITAIVMDSRAVQMRTLRRAFYMRVLPTLLHYKGRKLAYILWLRRLLSRIATCLCPNAPECTDLLSLKPETVLSNALQSLRASSPNLDEAVTLLVPFAILGYGLHHFVWKRPIFTWLVEFISSYFVGQITIPVSSPLNKQVLAWVAEHGLGEQARSLALQVPDPAQRRPTGDPYGLGRREYIDRRGRLVRALEEAEVENARPALTYVPNIGTYDFRFDGHFLRLTRPGALPAKTEGKSTENSMNSIPFDSTMEQPLMISCWSLTGTLKPIKSFLDYVDASSAPTKACMTTVYRESREDKGYWDHGISRPSRTLESVSMEADKKDAIARDVARYLSPATRIWYANRGYPYKRGYLLYGPPGTGKTSFSVALAGHFKLGIYIISLSDKTLTDNRLERLFDSLPNKCIVLLEDIDACGLERMSMKKEKRSRKNKRYQSPHDLVNPPVTLSGLLNVLDGPCSKDGRVVCMTSNMPDNLDAALVRPGRIDHKILFGYCSKEVCAELFRHVFTKTPEEMVEGEVSDEYDVNALAESFAREVPEDKLSPAEVQGFLMIHRDEPLKALADAGAWALETVEAKATGANVAAFKNEIEKVGNDRPSGKDANFDIHAESHTSSSDSESEGEDITDEDTPPSSYESVTDAAKNS